MQESMRLKYEPVSLPQQKARRLLYHSTTSAAAQEFFEVLREIFSSIAQGADKISQVCPFSCLHLLLCWSVASSVLRDRAAFSCVGPDGIQSRRAFIINTR